MNHSFNDNQLWCSRTCSGMVLVRDNRDSVSHCGFEWEAVAPRRLACSKSFGNSYNFRVILYNKRWFSLLLRSISRTSGIFWMKPELDPLRVIFFFSVAKYSNEAGQSFFFFLLLKAVIKLLMSFCKRHTWLCRLDWGYSCVDL